MAIRHNLLPNSRPFSKLMDQHDWLRLLRYKSCPNQHRCWPRSARTVQVSCWDRGRPARKHAKGAQPWEAAHNPFSRFALICGRDARGPSKSLDRLKPATPVLLLFDAPEAAAYTQLTATMSRLC